MVDWTDTDSVYGSGRMRMAMSGDLKRVKAVILADMIGQKNLEIPKETGSTKWLTDLVWSTATQLGYGKVFVTRDSPVEDDHQPFLKRGVPAVDLIDLDGYQAYWHTPQDTLDKISAQTSESSATWCWRQLPSCRRTTIRAALRGAGSTQCTVLDFPEPK